MRITDEIINDRAAVEKSLKAHKEAMKILEEKKQLLDSELIAKMDKEGQDLAGTSIAKCTIVEESYPRLENAEAFFDHVSESKDYSLLYKRVGVKAWREYHVMYGNPPGVEESTVKKIAITLIK